MNNLKKLLAISLLLSSVAVESKVATTVAIKEKKAVVDVEKVATTANYFQQKQMDIKLKLDPEGKAIEADTLAFQKSIGDFQSKMSTMSDTKKQEEGQKLAQMEQALKAKQQAFQTKAQSILAEVQKELITMISKVCEKLGFTEVDHKQGKLFVHQSLDKTDEIIAELNKTTKAPAKPKIA